MTDLDPKTLWQDQPVEATPMSLAEIKRRADWSVRIITFRNGADHFANIGMGILLSHGAIYFFDEIPFKIASVIGVLCCAASSFLLWRRASVMAPPAEANAQALVAFQRAQLTRQLEAVHLSWTWYLAPLLVIVIAFSVAFMVSYPTDRGPRAVLVYAIATALAVMVTLAVNIIRAQRFKRKIAELDAAS